MPGVRVELKEPGAPRVPAGPALFAYGFRPFFLFGAAYAGAALFYWLLAWHGVVGTAGHLPPSYWHGREMLFGFATAGLAGFLLTAVPSWTGTEAVRGRLLSALFLLWLAGRILAWWPGDGARPWFAIADLAFLPALALLALSRLKGAAGRRNLLFFPLFAVLLAANAATHFDGYLDGFVSARWGLMLALSVFCMMIGVIGGRIVPSFTRNGLLLRGIRIEIPAPDLLDRLALASLGLFVLANLLGLEGGISGSAAALAALLNLLRMARWNGHRTLGDPLLWSLHAGYAWLVLGLSLRAASDLAGVVEQAVSTHALGAGAVGAMMLAVMSRASLGHTGRSMKAVPALTAAFVLVSSGAALRVLSAALPGIEGSDYLLAAGGMAWSMAFLLFAMYFAPILMAPRADGRAG